MAPRVLTRAVVAAAGAAVGFTATRAGPKLVEWRVERRFNVANRPPPYQASERARELHGRLLVADLHADSLLYGRDLLRRSAIGHVDVPRLIEGNVALQSLAACVRVASHLNVERNEDTSDDVRLIALALGWPPSTWRSGLARALHLAHRARAFAERSGGDLRVIETAADLRRYLERRAEDPAMTAALLTIEGAAALDGDVTNVHRLADAGFRLFGLTHMVDNEFAGSSSGVEQGGLTARGRELVGELEARRVLVDVAHASSRTVSDVLGVARRPVVASHTGVAAVVPSPRSLSDEHVRAIGATGGVVGIGFWPAVVGGEDAAAIARSIAHAVTVAGIDHVALGSDFDGAVPAPFDATGMVQLTDALLELGFEDADVAKLMGGNVFRLLAEALPA
ncbi:MAG TPA: membrane dipeptidase [Vitreimonas sp.]|nr:membrane dipeptidase [Vitreimonas sp.]